MLGIMMLAMIIMMLPAMIIMMMPAVNRVTMRIEILLAVQVAVEESFRNVIHLIILGFVLVVALLPTDHLISAAVLYTPQKNE